MNLMFGANIWFFIVEIRYTFLSRIHIIRFTSISHSFLPFCPTPDSFDLESVASITSIPFWLKFCGVWCENFPTNFWALKKKIPLTKGLVAIEKVNNRLVHGQVKKNIYTCIWSRTDQPVAKIFCGILSVCGLIVSWKGTFFL